MLACEGTEDEDDDCVEGSDARGVKVCSGIFEMVGSPGEAVLVTERIGGVGRGVGATGTSVVAVEDESELG